MGAIVLTTGGVVAAFGLASCCALPVLLGTAGLSTAWLGTFAVLSAPHRLLLIVTASVCLLAASLLLVRQHTRRCSPDAFCSRPLVRNLNIAALLVGLGLLCLGYIYV